MSESLQTDVLRSAGKLVVRAVCQRFKSLLDTGTVNVEKQAPRAVPSNIPGTLNKAATTVARTDKSVRANSMVGEAPHDRITAPAGVLQRNANFPILTHSAAVPRGNQVQNHGKHWTT